MPTPKQVRFHYGKIATLRAKLQEALNDAHRAEVIVYDNYDVESPCKTLYETWDRMKTTTEKTLAEAMRTEIYRSNRSKRKASHEC